mgnify:CR=1 FL=1
MKLSSLCYLFALTAFVTVALPSCGGDDSDDISTPVTPPNNNNGNNNGTTNTDPEGTQDMALKVGNSQSVINGATSVDAQFNLTGGMIASLGKVNGLGAVTSIPKTGWVTSAPVNIGAGYVVYNEATEVFCRMYIVGQDGEGYHVKYQVPFRGTEEELRFSSSEVSFPAEGGTKELTIANSSIVPFTVSSSEEWCEVEKIQPGTGVRITCGPSEGTAATANITLIQASNNRAMMLKVTREGLTHNAVDLGLSVQWCDRNLGALSIEGTGNYYAWGETEPKEKYTWDTYSYGSSKNNVRDIGMNISGTQYDAATKLLGDGWRIPTRAEFIELKNKCTWERATENGVEGYRATGPSGKSIFFARRGGYHSYGSVYQDDYFYAWMANRSIDLASEAAHFWTIEYSSGSFGTVTDSNNGSAVCDGLQIRAVKGKPFSDPESNYTSSGSVGGHNYVDLGLSVKWATCNIGATNPWDYGNYFDWSSSRSDWGSSWRMPTKEEMNELLQCTIEYTVYHNIGGIRVTGKNGKSIFIPATGYKFYYNSPLNYWDTNILDSDVFCWSSTPDVTGSSAYILRFNYEYGYSASCYSFDYNNILTPRLAIRLVAEEGSSDSGTKGTAANPFTPTEAIAYESSLAEGIESSQDYYIRGKVFYISEQYGTEYGNATFFLSGGEPFSKTFQWAEDAFFINSAFYLGNEKYAGQSLLLNEGDEVVVCGKLFKPHGEIPGTVQGKAYVVSINGTTHAN